jgi:hypothetical protein
MGARGTFLSNIAEIRRRAREDLAAGAVTKNYGGDVKEAIAVLNPDGVAERAASQYVEDGTSWT